jgi:hypothetical protein
LPNHLAVLRAGDGDINLAAAVTTIAQAASTNIVYRGIAFTPEARSSP